MKLVADWKQAWRWVSMRCMVAATAIQGAWMFIPDDMRSSIPQNVVEKITIALLVAGGVGRLVQQEGKKDVD